MSNDAMTGLATGNRTGKAAEREQQIHTPDVILDICRTMWGAIHLDPCASPVRSIGAVKNYDHDGLTDPWCNYAYVNPPYRDLKLWLQKSTFEYFQREVTEQVLLFPVRTNRVWWCEYMNSSVVSSVAWLKPLKFVGYKAAFPAPLCLVYTGQKVNDFGSLVKGLATHVGKLG